MVSKGVKGFIEITEKEIQLLIADRSRVENDVTKRILQTAIDNRKEKLVDVKRKYDIG